MPTPTQKIRNAATVLTGMGSSVAASFRVSATWSKRQHPPKRFGLSATPEPLIYMASGDLWRCGGKFERGGRLSGHRCYLQRF